VQANETSGKYAVDLIAKEVTLIKVLQPNIFEQEALHQLRVSMRRLRAIVRQFKAALRLPKGVSEGRIAKLARATGLCRDLDVVIDLLNELLPTLPKGEQKVVTRALEQLGKDRGAAFAELSNTWRSAASKTLISEIGAFCAQPRTTHVGAQPVTPWLFEWSHGCGELFLDPGWFATDPYDPALHDVRKRLKMCRYYVEHLAPHQRDEHRDSSSSVIATLALAQDLLGDLRDVQMMEMMLAERVKGGNLQLKAPTLNAIIKAQVQEKWLAWKTHGDLMCSQEGRHALYSFLLGGEAIFTSPRAAI